MALACSTVMLLVIFSIAAHAQPADSAYNEADSIMPSVYDQQADDTALPDSSRVTPLSFDSTLLQQLKSDPDLQYREQPTVGESLWTRFQRWLADWIASILDSATNTNWGRVLTYLFAFVCLVIITMMVMKVNAFRIFFGDKAVPLQHQVIDENIHEMDFERLIQEALARKDYRLGVRLLFLHALKILSDKNQIHWMQGKTNRDYLNELSSGEVRQGFSQLSYFFEYAWYGNFAITDGMYARVRQIFDSWKRTI